MSDCVFFYGTLLPQHAPPDLRGVLAKLKAVGEGSVRGVLIDLGEYPGAVLDDSAETRDVGRVFRLTDEPLILDVLDRYEGFDPASPRTSLFVRKRVDVVLDDGRIISSWVYEYNGNPTGAPIIASGRYKNGAKQ